MTAVEQDLSLAQRAAHEARRQLFFMMARLESLPEEDRAPVTRMLAASVNALDLASDLLRPIALRLPCEDDLPPWEEV